ncbi:fimbrial protein [Klebsiella sp. R445]
MRIVNLIALLILVFPGITLAATCSVTAKTKTNTLSGTITVPRNVSPGDAIGGLYGPFSGGTSSVSCTGIPYLYVSFASTQQLSSFTDIYKTNIPGVGVKVWSSFSGKVMVGNADKYWYRSNASSGSWWLASVYLQFYAIDSNIGQGKISLSSPFVRSRAGDYRTTYSYLSFNSSLTINPEKGCSVTNSSQTVTLSEVKKNELRNSPGRHSDGKGFNIGLNCTPQTKVSVAFEGPTMSGHDSVLANQTTGNNSAGSSVGIQMLYDNSPVILGKPLQVVTDAQSSETIPFTAHYYYNGGADIQAGNVTAVTTFTFTYQ